MLWSPREKKGINIINSAIYIYAPHEQTHSDKQVRIMLDGRETNLGWNMQIACGFNNESFVDLPRKKLK